MQAPMGAMDGLSNIMPNPPAASTMGYFLSTTPTDGVIPMLVQTVSDDHGNPRIYTKNLGYSGRTHQCDVLQTSRDTGMVRLCATISINC